MCECVNIRQDASYDKVTRREAFGGMDGNMIQGKSFRARSMGMSMGMSVFRHLSHTLKSVFQTNTNVFRGGCFSVPSCFFSQ